MSMRRRRRRSGGMSEAKVDMNSLIDLTFLLLVVFIVTLPTLEQSVHIVLPVGKTSKVDDEKKSFSVSIDKDGQLFLGEAPVTKDRLKETLMKAVEENPEVNVLIRGDIGADYGDVYDVVKVAKDCNVKHLGLVSKEN